MSILATTPPREQTIYDALHAATALAHHLNWTRHTYNPANRRMYAELLAEVAAGIVAECAAIADECAARDGATVAP